MKNNAHQSQRTTPDLAATINSIFGWHRHPRNGKVARLPEAIRLQINRMLDDGMMYRTILAKLRETNPEDFPYHLSEMNLSNWFRGGYQDWRRKPQDNALTAITGHPPVQVATTILNWTRL